MLDARVGTLILGSFPSAASLAAREYYAHPRNQFWPILAAILGEPLAALAYPARLERLLAHRLGLWDVVAVCERQGSLDAAIRNPEPNDLAALRVRLPRLRRVLFNGLAAGQAAPAFRSAGVTALVLPSTSPAFAAMSLAAKIDAWRRALRDDRVEMPAGRGSKAP